MLSLAMHTSPEAFERPRCHEKTRVAILQHLRDWVNGVVQLYAKMLWLYGDAGAGKSTIAQTLAEQLNGKQLIASFFFSRNDGSRASHTSLVATIVYQAALAIPGLRILVDEAVMLNPQIFDQNLAAQLKHLLVEPLNTLLKAPAPSFDTVPSLIIIDGLDECSNPQMQSRILEAFSDALRSCQYPLKLLVASRPENNISLIVGSPKIANFATQLALDHKYFPDHDIRVFLQDKFKAIQTTHRLKSFIPTSWPGQSVSEELVHKSSGQFVYASTVVKYIASPDHNPVDRLRIVQGLEQNISDRDLPFANLDVLYRHMLSKILEEDLDMVLKIISISACKPLYGKANLGYIVRVADEFRDTNVIRSLLNLRGGDVERYLGGLTLIIHFKKYGEPFRDRSGVQVQISHASFTDFLGDKRRSLQYCIGTQGQINALAVQLCLGHLQQGVKAGPYFFFLNDKIAHLRTLQTGPR